MRKIDNRPAVDEQQTNPLHNTAAAAETVASVGRRTKAIEVLFL